MNLYVNGKEKKVQLYAILTQKLYEKVTPILDKLANSKGANAAFETELQRKIFSDEYLLSKIDLSQGADAWKGLANDFKFTEIVTETMLYIKTNLLEHINIDSETIPDIFTLAKTCIDTSKINDSELLSCIESDVDSEFWQEQDINNMLEELKFFRKTILSRIKSSI